MTCWLYSLNVELMNLFGASRIEWIANLRLILLGAMLILAEVRVRVWFPNGVPLALATLFEQQSLSLPNA